MNCRGRPELLVNQPMTLRTKILLLLAASATLLFASCNTMTGLGQDMQRAGEGIENRSQGQPW